MKIVLDVGPDDRLPHSSRCYEAGRVSHNRVRLVSQQVRQRVEMEKPAGKVRAKGIALNPLDVAAEFHGVTPLGVNQVVIRLPRIPTEPERSRDAEASREASIEFREWVEGARRLSRDEAESGIGHGGVNGCRARGRCHAVAIVTGPKGINQLGSENVILFETHHYPRARVLDDFVLVLVVLA